MGGSFPVNISLISFLCFFNDPPVILWLIYPEKENRLEVYYD
jgi:hypothetical protein